MARAGLSRMDIKRARDALLAQGQHPSIDAIRIALGNTGSKSTIHRYLKELEEEDGASLTRAGSLSDAIQDLVARLAARLHEEAQAVVDQQTATAAAQRLQAQAEIAKLAGDVAALRAQLAEAGAAVVRERAIPGAGVTDRLFDRQARRCLSFGRAVAWKCSPPIARLPAGRSFPA